MSEAVRKFREKFSETVKPFGDIRHPVWSGGDGPPIILMHELDGFTPAFMGLALRLSETFTVHAPVFYGEAGQTFDGPIGTTRAVFCMRREFEAFRLGRTSPIAGWIRALAADIHEASADGKGVGVVGMCMTGGIVLATIAHPSVAVGVAAQPSLPLARFGSRRCKEDLGLDAQDLEAAAGSGTPVLTLRYGKDAICPAERIAAIADKIPLVSAPPAFLNGVKSHATLTDFYRDKPHAICEVSAQAIDHAVSFLSEHLRTQSADG